MTTKIGEKMLEMLKSHSHCGNIYILIKGISRRNGGIQEKYEGDKHLNIYKVEIFEV